MEVTVAVFIQVPGKQVMPRRKNRSVEVTVGVGMNTHKKLAVKKLEMSRKRWEP